MIIVLVLLGIMALLGVAAILHQAVTGFKETNLNDKYVWGLYIQGCFYLSSIALGILMTISTMTLLGIQGVDSIMEYGNIAAFSLLIGAQVLLGLDLGKPNRALLMLGSKNFRSPLTLDFYALGASTVLSFAYIFGVIQNNPVILGIWSIFMLIAGNLCISAHTMFFLSRSKGGYQTNAFLGLETLLYSLLGGVSVLATIAIAFEIKTVDLSKSMLIIAIFLVLTGIGHQIALLNQEKAHSNKILYLNIFILILLGLNQIAFTNQFIVLTAAILVFVSIFIEKYHTVIHSQSVSIIPEPYSQFQDKQLYTPSIKEWTVLIGGLAVCALISYGIYFLKTSL